MIPSTIGITVVLMASDEEDVDGDEDDKRLVEEDDVEAG